MAALIATELQRMDEAGSGRYFEPFLGGGSVFRELDPAAAVLGDLNSDLIHFYQMYVERPGPLRQLVEVEGAALSAARYLELRTEFNNGAKGIRRAAIFFVLNRAGFNGLWRVNRLGKYTVPYGRRGLALLPIDEWEVWAKTLSRAVLVNADYRRTLAEAGRGDVVYLDPPYLGDNRECFSRYTAQGFGAVDHRELRSTVDSLAQSGVHVLLTCRDTPYMRELYAHHNIGTVAVVSSVGGGRGRIPMADLVVTTS